MPSPQQSGPSISFPLHDAGACWECDESVYVPTDKRAYAAQFQMLFCCQECHTLSMQKGTLYGRALVSTLRPSMT
jgi:hypothetical protein